MLSRASILSQRRLQELPAQLRRLVRFSSVFLLRPEKALEYVFMSFCVILWTFPTKTESADFKNKDKASTPGDVQDGLSFKFDIFFVQAKPTLRGIGNSGAYDDFESALQHEPESGALSHEVSTGGLQTSQLFATAKKTIQDKYGKNK